MIMPNKPWSFDAPVRRIGEREVGAGRPVYVTGEIGINHNGELANAIALIDVAVQRLPDVLTLPASGGTLLLLTAAQLAGEPGSLGRAAAAAAVLTAGFLLIAFTGAMWLGDVKLAPALGALLGWSSWTALFWGAAAGFVVGAVSEAARMAVGRARRTHVAFGPYMVIGALAVSVTAA